MAFHHHKLILKLDASLPEKAVLHVLAVYSDKCGKCWPSQETIAEDSGLAVRTVRKAITSLRNKGIIETKKFIYGTKYAITLSSTKAPRSVICTPLPAPDAGLPAKCTDEHTTCPTTENQTIESLADSKANNMKPDKYPTGMTSDKALTIVSGKTYINKPKVGKKIGPTDLEYLWKETLPLIYPDIGMQKNFTKVDLGMLKHFINGVAPQDSYAILNTVLHNWSGYTEYVTYMTGVKGVPQRPVIPYILKYCTEAANFHLEGLKPKKVTSVSKPAKPKPVAPPVQKPVYKSNKITLEEIEALEKELGL